MSATEGEKKTRPRGGSDRRRRPQGTRKPRAPRPAKEETAPKVVETTEVTAEKPKRERAPIVPVPSDMIGKTITGTVYTVIRRGRFNFGFITPGTDGTVDEKTPQIYFNPSCLGDAGLVLRKGYTVECTVELDEEKRSVAKNIKLTAEGVKAKEEREAEIAKKRAERQQQAPAAQPEKKEEAAEEKKDAPRRQKRIRKRPEGRTVTLKVKVEGGNDEKSIEANVSQSIGKLKSIAVTATGAATDCSVYYVSAENPKGEFLTKAIFSKLNDNDTILLGPKRDTTTA